MEKNLSLAVAAALRLLEHSAAERGVSNFALPIEAEIAVLRLCRHAAETAGGGEE
ncbi:hypothetical protein [Roseomonas rosulenta]|uniref:hypothetical protein n=1 Tax=Roseomonas rosulenta TaxID=2748667 RepID=UPI0018E039BC|nr:hypothetical protein [Roseomonas rosulenta]